MSRSRVRAIVEAARPLLTGVDLDHRQDEWDELTPFDPLRRLSWAPSRLRSAQRRVAGRAYAS